MDALLLLQHCETEGDAYREALTTCEQMLGNLMKYTDVTPEQKIKFRRIKVANKTFQKRVGSRVGGQEVFMAIGFQHVNTAAAAAAAKEKEGDDLSKSAGDESANKSGSVEEEEVELVLHPGRENSDIISRVYKTIDSVLSSFNKAASQQG